MTNRKFPKGAKVVIESSRLSPSCKTWTVTLAGEPLASGRGTTRADSREAAWQALEEMGLVTDS